MSRIIPQRLFVSVFGNRTTEAVDAGTDHLAEKHQNCINRRRFALKK